MQKKWTDNPANWLIFYEHLRVHRHHLHFKHTNTIVKTIPAYKKWLSAPAASSAQPLATSFAEPCSPGDIIEEVFDNSRNQDPPTNGEVYNIPITINVPYALNEDGEEVPITARLDVTYTVEDWGTAALNNELILDLTSSTEGADGYGGHATWTGKCSAALATGSHNLHFVYQNIIMGNEMNNKIVCEYGYKLTALETGGKKAPQPCSTCRGNTCGPDGGIANSQSSRSLSATAVVDSSSAGTSVIYDVTDDSMLWSCNTGTLRGQGASLNGKVQLYTDTFDSTLATPAALAFNHPMEATLLIPEGGAVLGSLLEIHIGDRVIALRYYKDGSIAPVGVDSAGKGMATLTLTEEETLATLKWQDSAGAAWVFDGSTGELLSYTSPEKVTVNNVSALLQVKRSADGTQLRQVWSYWDGLLNIEAVTDTGYRVALYTPGQVAGLDAEGYYTLIEGAAPFKTFTFSYAGTGLTVVETTPGREDYACTWSKGEDGAWSITRGSGADAIVTSRVRTVVEPVSMTNPYEVWQMVTTISKGGIAASCVCDVYQNSPMGNLLLTHVEGYGSTVGQTTSYEYDAVGNVVAQIAPNGHRVEHMYDETGRLIKTTEPWGAGDHHMITCYAYANSSAERYSDELASVTRKLRKVGSNTMPVISSETYIRTEEGGIHREEQHSTAAGSAHTHVAVTETWTGDAPNALDRGRTRMTQAVNGVQTWYSYAYTTEHGALYTITTETRVESEPVAGQSRRSVSYINEEGNTTREEEYILLSSGIWQKISGSNHSYNVQNQRVGTLHDNGRSSSREMTCTGDILWEIDENGVRTDYAYDSARRLIEISRAEVREGETVITPETITEYVRDAAGRVTSTITRTGAMETTQSATYDAAGRIVSQTDVLGRTSITAYSEDGLTTTVTTPRGATLVTSSNSNGSVAHVSGSGQRELRYRYDLSGSSRRETTLLANGTTEISQSVTNGFDETTMKCEASTTGFIYTRYEYNNKGQLVRNYQDTGWNTTPTAATLYEYNGMGMQVKRTLALEEEPTAADSPIEESSYGAESTEEGVYATTTTTRYSAGGTAVSTIQKHLISRLSASLESKTLSINERGLTSAQWTEYNAGTKRTRYSTIPTSTLTAAAVSVDGFTVSSTDHAGITTSQTRAYTSTGMTLTQTDGRGNTTTSSTDKAGRATSMSDAAGNTTTTDYCADCDKTATITNAQGKTTCYRYDLRERKVAEWGTAIQPATFAYDDADRLIRLSTFRVDAETISSDPSERTDGDSTIWTYHDATGLELTKTYADGQGSSKNYDAYKRLASETDARGITKTHSYEQARGLLLGTTYSDGTTARAYTYNHLGQLTQVTDDAGVRAIAYNTYGEQETDSLVAGKKTHLVTELRDELGRSSGYTYARNGSVQQAVSYGYAADGRLNTAGFIHGGEDKPFTYGYLAGSHLLQTLAMPNNMTLTQQYETQRNLLTGMEYKRGETGVVERYYTYDTLGRPTARTENRQGGSRSDTFTHNDRSELTAATLGSAEYSYDYDNIGNRKTAQENAEEATNYDANSLNQYTAVGSFTPTYDAAGNQTLVQTSTGIWNVTYNAENRPVMFTKADGSVRVTCTYDYMGRRATKKVETITPGEESGEEVSTVTLHHRYLYRGYLQVACCDLTRSEHPSLWFILWDPTQSTATRPLAIQKDATWYCYGWDLTKNICEVFSNTGIIKTTYSYTPYGAVTASGTVTQPIQWSSEFNDDELGLVYYNYRHYNPADGIWISRDKAKRKNAASLYNYIGNASLNSVDLLGLLRYVSDEDIYEMPRYGTRKYDEGRRIYGETVCVWPKEIATCDCNTLRLADISIMLEVYLYERDSIGWKDNNHFTISQHERVHVNSYAYYWNTFVTIAWMEFAKTCPTKKECEASLEKLENLSATYKRRADQAQKDYDNNAY